MHGKNIERCKAIVRFMLLGSRGYNNETGSFRPYSRDLVPHGTQMNSMTVPFCTPMIPLWGLCKAHNGQLDMHPR